MTQFYRGAQPYAPTSGAAHSIWLTRVARRRRRRHQADLAMGERLLRRGGVGFGQPDGAGDGDGQEHQAGRLQLVHPQGRQRWPGGHGRRTASPQGKAALAAHKAITYVGATGPITFDQYQNSPGAFEIVRADGSTIKAYTPQDLQSLK